MNLQTFYEREYELIGNLRKLFNVEYNKGILDTYNAIKSLRASKEFYELFNKPVETTNEKLTNQDVNNLIKSVDMTFGNRVAATELISKLNKLIV